MWFVPSQKRALSILIFVLLTFAAIAYAQSDVQELTLVLNGHSGQILVYRINGEAFVDVEALARIGQGSASVQKGELVLTFPTAVASAAAGAPVEGADSLGELRVARCLDRRHLQSPASAPGFGQPTR